jgi:hypothetical protein
MAKPYHATFQSSARYIFRLRHEASGAPARYDPEKPAKVGLRGYEARDDARASPAAQSDPTSSMGVQIEVRAAIGFQSDEQVVEGESDARSIGGCRWV